MTIYYQDDLVTLYHGDCLEVTAWLEADVLVTDPPYGIKAESTKGTWRGSEPRLRNAADILGDETTEVRDAVIKLWGDRSRIVFGSWRMPRPEPVHHRLIWHKKGNVRGFTGTFVSQDEEIYVTGSGFAKSAPPMRSVIATSEPRQGKYGAVAMAGHPTPKPVGLMELLVARCPAGTVADPFAGSGSTLIAARNLGRKSIGVEMEERYCELIAKRLSQQTFDFGELTA